MRIFNEYISVDAGRRSGSDWQVDYEPAEHQILDCTLSGYVLFAEDDMDGIHFYVEGYDRRYIGTESTLIRYGLLRGNRITLYWEFVPPEHCLCVTYEVPDFPLGEDTYKKEWLKEGF